MATFGLALEAELDAVKGRSKASIERKRAMVLNKWLDRPQQYRSPSATKGSAAGPTSGADETMTISGDGSGWDV